MNSKLAGLKEGETIGINCWPVIPGMKKLSQEKEEQIFLYSLKDNCGRGHVVENNGKQLIAVLMDIDYETDPTNKRHIFTFFNPTTGLDETKDTLYDKNWKVYDLDAAVA